MSETHPLKKMSTSSVMELARGEKMQPPTTHTPLCAIYGVVTGFAKSKSAYDPDDVVLIGRFKAVRAKDRKAFTAEKLHLPDKTYQKQLAEAVRPDTNGEVHYVNFGFNIGFAPMPSSPTGYNFTCSPMLDVKAQDQFAEIEHQIDLDKFLPKLLAAPADKNAKK